MSKSASISDTFERMCKELNGIHDTRYFIVMLHLYLEFWMNQIIEKKCKNPDKIKNFNFSPKLKILNSFNIVPDELYHDIKIFNDLRNTFVHDLDIKENKIDEKLIQLKNKNAKKVLDSPKSHVRLIGSVTALMAELYSIFFTDS
ncbi:MAG: hypothetical protein IIA83_09990 [Thaumarchaeota archaeon]|nr:hypothetical protein [Nitrososphaerota archaeon]